MTDEDRRVQICWKGPTRFDFDATLRSFLDELPWMEWPPAYTPLDGLITEPDPDYDMAESYRKAQKRLAELLPVDPIPFRYGEDVDPR